MSWLSELLEQHSELESPRSFWKWSALCAISAIVKDNVWFHKQSYNVYPNIYVMLYADSGLKKGPPISMAKQLVGYVNNTNMIVGRSSIQGILKEMGGGESQPGGRISTKSKAFICASELSSSVVSDDAAMDILTDLYDRNLNNIPWKSLLKMESFSLDKPTVTLLVGSNEAHNEKLFLRKDIQGGFFARTFIIHESKRNRINSLMFPLKSVIDYKKSAEYLKVLAGLHGPLEMDHETRVYQDEWYNDFCNTIDIQQVKDMTGTLNRFDDSVLKVAILLSLAESPKLEIKLETLKNAIAECEKLIGNVRRTTMGKGKNPFAAESALVIQELLDRDNHTITRMQLNKKYRLHASSDDWDNIMKSLEVAGIIRVETIGSNIVYEMPESQVGEWRKQMEGKNK